MFKKILIPIDWSIHSEEVSTEIILEIAEKFSPKFYFLHVIELFTLPFLKETRELEEKIVKEKTAEYFKKFEDKILKKMQNKVEFSYEFVTKIGNPADEICKFADEKNVGLIAMASHGYGEMSRWAMGSVADKVSHHSNKPFLLLPRREKSK